MFDKRLGKFIINGKSIYSKMQLSKYELKRVLVSSLI